jgi:hypothetical protein
MHFLEICISAKQFFVFFWGGGGRGANFYLKLDFFYCG